MGTPGPDSGFALRLARRFEHELKIGRGRVGARRPARRRRWSPPSGRPSSGAPRASTTSSSPSTPGASSTTRRPSCVRPAAWRSPPSRTTTSAQRQLVDSVPDEIPPAEPGGSPRPGAGRRCRIVLTGTDCRGGTGGDRPARDRGRRLDLHRTGLWPAGRASGPAPARLPSDLVGLARRAVGARPRRLPRHRARPAWLQRWCPPGRNGRLRHRASAR